MTLDPKRDPETFFCSCCQGTGRIEGADDKTIGLSVRAIRRKHDIPANWVAVTMGITPSYLSDLELGRRRWSLDLIRRYKDAVAKVRDGFNSGTK